jgi:very-short-patch-repair endonuclease
MTARDNNVIVDIDGNPHQDRAKDTAGLDLTADRFALGPG